jgi:septum formation protein
MEPIILASGSLRRQEYLKLLGIPFSIMPSYIEEIPAPGISPAEQAQRFAVQKVQKIMEVLEQRLPHWILGADTLITLDDVIFGKPVNREDASKMLQTFSGKSHQVITALALYIDKIQQIETRTVTSTVTFAQINPEELEWYLDTGEWQGVAGAYKIQGLASCFISEIQGSYSGIVGLPIREFYVMLREYGYSYGM